jgi:hypothetical protein
LGKNDSNDNPIAILGDVSKLSHHRVSPIEKKRNTLVSLLGVEVVSGDVVLEDPVLSINVEGHIIRILV